MMERKKLSFGFFLSVVAITFSTLGFISSFKLVQAIENAKSIKVEVLENNSLSKGHKLVVAYNNQNGSTA